MVRRLVLKTIFVLVLLLALAVPALAGGVVVSLDGAPQNATPGDPFEVGFTILSAHDGSPQVGMGPIVMLTNAATGETVEVTAEDSGEAGHYVAVVTLPSEGQWSFEIQPLGKYADNYPPSVMTPIQASAPAAAEASVPNTGQAAPEAAPLRSPQSTPGQTIALALAGSAVLFFAAAAWLQNRRGAAVRS